MHLRIFHTAIRRIQALVRAGGLIRWGQFQASDANISNKIERKDTGKWELQIGNVSSGKNRIGFVGCVGTNKNNLMSCSQRSWTWLKLSSSSIERRILERQRAKIFTVSLDESIDKRQSLTYEVCREPKRLHSLTVPILSSTACRPVINP